MLRALVLFFQLMPIPLFVVAFGYFLMTLLRREKAIILDAIRAGLVVMFLGSATLVFRYLFTDDLLTIWSIAAILGLGICSIIVISAGTTLSARVAGNFWTGKSTAGLSRRFLEIFLCATLLAVFGATVFGIMGAPITPPCDTKNVASIVVFLFSTTTWAASEECFYRGFVQQLVGAWTSQSKVGGQLAIISTAAIFTIQHSESAFQFARYVQILPVGVVCGLMFVRHGILGAIGVHVGFNLLGLVVP